MSSLFDGTHNARDVGGLPLPDGGTVRSGVLYRADALAALTDAGVAALSASPVGVVVDFRTDGERASAPDRLPDDRPITALHLPILEGATADLARNLAQPGTPDPAVVQAVLTALPTLGELYIGMLGHAAEDFARVAALVAASHDDEPTAVLVHCTAGKDRTGVTVALILDAVGVPRDAIVADYSASADNLAGPWAERILASVTRFGIPVTPALRELVTGSPAAAIQQALAWLDAHGGSADYLRSGGLTDAQLEALRARLRA